MRRALLSVACLAALACGWLALAPRADAAAFPCGLPDGKPLWIEFSDGSVDFRQAVFGKPGVIVATNGVERSAEMRALGAATVYWHMSLKGLVGTPTIPRDPSEVEARANALVDRAIAASGCGTPVIALNELNGVRAQTPWSPTVAQYRANVLKVFQVIGGSRAALPALLVPGPAAGGGAPFLDGDAAQWWREIAAAGIIVRELYFNAPYIYRQGPIVGPRLRRTAMRTAISALTAIGISPDRIGVMLGFQSGAGKGGREGLQPSSAWYQIVKQDALAAKQVAAETGISSIWSWGWGTFLHFAPEGADADKAVAACVYLWSRDPSLCDGPSIAGSDFNASVTEGQIILPEGAQCSIAGGVITTTAVDELVAATGGDRNAALRAALNRLLFASVGEAATDADVRSAEEAAVGMTLAGDWNAYQAQLDEHGIARATARRAIADLLLQRSAVALLRVQDPAVAPDRWLARSQRSARQTAICLKDELPTKGGFDWISFLPFADLPDASITAAPDRRVVKRGQSATLSGTVVSNRASESVTVYELGVRTGVYEAIGTAKVGSDGGWSFLVKPTGPVSTYVAVSRSAASKPVAVRVKGKPGKNA